MKKCVSVLAFALIASVGCAATLFTQKDPKPGIINIKGNANGRIASVDVFSMVENGTVQLSRLFTYSNYTNAYDITTLEKDVVTEIPVYDEFNMVRHDGKVFVLENVETNSYSIQEHYKCQSIVGDVELIFASSEGMSWLNGWFYNDGTKDRFSEYYSDFSKPRDAQEIVLTGPGDVVHCSFNRVGTHIGSYNYETNTVTTVKTNEIRKIKTYDLVVTNTIFTGSCTNYSLHGSMNDNVWLFPSDKLIFSGTATGGEMRIVIE